jgi:hypothetical protein
MQARTWISAAGLVAGLASAGRAAGDFEGVVAMTMTASKGQAMDILQTVKGTRSRQEMKAGGKTIVTIMDMAAGTITTLMPEQKMYMTMNLKQMGRGLGGVPGGMPPGARSMPAGAPPSPPKISATGKTEVLAGRTCEHYLMGDAPQQFDVCAAKGMGYFGMGGGSPMGGMGASALSAGLPPGWSDTMKAFADGFFPLKMERVEGARREPVMQVTKVEAKPVEDALFVPPPDYKEMKIPGLPFGAPKQ